MIRITVTMLIGVLSALVSGCTTSRGVPPAAMPAVAPDEVRDMQAARLDGLRRLHRYGVMEITWVDETGRTHREPQVSLNFWYEVPRRTALRIDKIGEVFFWIGSDDEAYWIFDLSADPSILTHGLHASSAGTRMDGLGQLSPLVLLDLLGLSEFTDVAVGTQVDPDGGPVHLMTTAGRALVTWDPVLGVPTSIAVLDTDGKVRMESHLEMYQSINVDGTGTMLFPRRVKVLSADRDLQLRIFFDTPPQPLSRQKWDRIFDPDRLQHSLRPDEVRSMTRAPAEP